MASLIRSVDCVDLEVDLTGEPVRSRVRISCDPPAEVALRLPPLAGDDVEPAHRERCGQQNARSRRPRRRSAPWPPGCRARSRRPRPARWWRRCPAPRSAMALASALAVVAADHLARDPAHRVEQRLAVVAEAWCGTSPTIPSWWQRDPAAVDELAHVLPHLEVALDDPVDQPARPRPRAAGGVSPTTSRSKARLTPSLSSRERIRPIRIVSSKNRCPRPLHLVEQQVEPGQPRLEVAQHLLVEQGELARRCSGAPRRPAPAA